MLYISGLHALNINCQLETTGDWHLSGIQWDKLHLLESDESIFKDYGIETNKSIPYHTEKFNVANHIRACLDLLEQGMFSIADGMNDNFICNPKYNKIIFDKVLLLINCADLSRGKKIFEFMLKEYKLNWLNYIDNK